jgi:hypothetical protein
VDHVEGFEVLESPDNLVQVAVSYDHSSGLTVLRATTLISASPEECAALELDKMSRVQVKAAEGLSRNVIKDSGHNIIAQSIIDMSHLGASRAKKRELVSKIVWRWISSFELAVAYDDTEVDKFPINDSRVRAKLQALWKYERSVPFTSSSNSSAAHTISPSFLRLPFHAGDGTMKMTRATCMLKADLGEGASEQLTVQFCRAQVLELSRIRSSLDRSQEVNLAKRTVTIEKLSKGLGAKLTPEQDALVKTGSNYFTMFEKEKKTQLKAPHTVRVSSSEAACDVRAKRRSRVGRQRS